MFRFEYILMPVSITEQQEQIYRLLEENCDFIFCKSQEKTKEYLFYCKEQFTIFATNGGGDVYVFIGGIGGGCFD